jgi:hypothetical protein
MVLGKAYDAELQFYFDPAEKDDADHGSTWKVVSASNKSDTNLSQRKKIAATSIFFTSVDACKTDKVALEGKKAVIKVLSETKDAAGKVTKVMSTERDVKNYNLCAKNLDKKVAASDALFKGMGKPTKGTKKNLKINWATVLKGINMEYFYQYSGSQTKPPCTEGVEWNVYSKVLYTRSKYIDSLKNEFSKNEKFAFGGKQGNNRRTQ